MFDERRQTSVKGIDRSYPLEPLDNKPRKQLASNGLTSTQRNNNLTTVKRVARADVNSNLNGGKPIVSYHEEITRETFQPSLRHGEEQDEDDEEEEEFGSENHAMRYGNGNHGTSRNERHEDVLDEDTIQRNRLMAKIHLMQYDETMKHRVRNDLESEQFPEDLMIDVPDKPPKRNPTKKLSQAEARLERFKNANAKRNATKTVTSTTKKRSEPMFPAKSYPRENERRRREDDVGTSGSGSPELTKEWMRNRPKIIEKNSLSAVDPSRARNPSPRLFSMESSSRSDSPGAHSQNKKSNSKKPEQVREMGERWLDRQVEIVEKQTARSRSQSPGLFSEGSRGSPGTGRQGLSNSPEDSEKGRPRTSKDRESWRRSRDEVIKERTGEMSWKIKVQDERTAPRSQSPGTSSNRYTRAIGSSETSKRSSPLFFKVREKRNEKETFFYDDFTEFQDRSSSPRFFRGEGEKLATTFTISSNAHPPSPETIKKNIRKNSANLQRYFGRRESGKFEINSRNLLKRESARFESDKRLEVGRRSTSPEFYCRETERLATTKISLKPPTITKDIDVQDALRGSPRLKRRDTFSATESKSTDSTQRAVKTRDSSPQFYSSRSEKILEGRERSPEFFCKETEKSATTYSLKPSTTKIDKDLQRETFTPTKSKTFKDHSQRSEKILEGRERSPEFFCKETEKSATTFTLKPTTTKTGRHSPGAERTRDTKTKSSHTKDTKLPCREELKKERFARCSNPTSPDLSKGSTLDRISKDTSTIILRSSELIRDILSSGNKDTDSPLPKTQKLSRSSSPIQSRGSPKITERSSEIHEVTMCDQFIEREKIQTTQTAKNKSPIGGTYTKSGREKLANAQKSKIDRMFTYQVQKPSKKRASILGMNIFEGKGRGATIERSRSSEKRSNKSGAEKSETSREEKTIEKKMEALPSIDSIHTSLDRGTIEDSKRKSPVFVRPDTNNSTGKQRRDRRTDAKESRVIEKLKKLEKKIDEIEGKRTASLASTKKNSQSAEKSTVSSRAISKSPEGSSGRSFAKKAMDHSSKSRSLSTWRETKLDRKMTDRRERKEKIGGALNSYSLVKKVLSSSEGYIPRESAKDREGEGSRERENWRELLENETKSSGDFDERTHRTVKKQEADYRKSREILDESNRRSSILEKFYFSRDEDSVDEVDGTMKKIEERSIISDGKGSLLRSVLDRSQRIMRSIDELDEKKNNMIERISCEKLFEGSTLDEDFKKILRSTTERQRRGESSVSKDLEVRETRNKIQSTGKKNLERNESVESALGRFDSIDARASERPYSSSAQGPASSKTRTNETVNELLGRRKSKNGNQKEEILGGKGREDEAQRKVNERKGKKVLTNDIKIFNNTRASTGPICKRRLFESVNSEVKRRSVNLARDFKDRRISRSQQEISGSTPRDSVKHLRSIEDIRKSIVEPDELEKKICKMRSEAAEKRSRVGSARGALNAACVATRVRSFSARVPIESVVRKDKRANRIAKSPSPDPTARKSMETSAAHPATRRSVPSSPSKSPDIVPRRSSVEIKSNEMRHSRRSQPAKTSVDSVGNKKATSTTKTTTSKTTTDVVDGVVLANGVHAPNDAPETRFENEGSTSTNRRTDAFAVEFEDEASKDANATHSIKAPGRRQNSEKQHSAGPGPAGARPTSSISSVSSASSGQAVAAGKKRMATRAKTPNAIPITSRGDSVAKVAAAGSASGSSAGSLTPCKVCGRRFAQERVVLHEQICAKSVQKKRKQFDAMMYRVRGTELEPFVKKGLPKNNKSESRNAKSAGKSNWRRKHEDFINAIRSAKQVQAHLAAGGKLSDLPPPPASDTSDYIQCPHCGRKFNQSAAERHIPKCEHMLHNKPAHARAPPRPKR